VVVVVVVAGLGVVVVIGGLAVDWVVVEVSDVVGVVVVVGTGLVVGSVLQQLSSVHSVLQSCSLSQKPSPSPIQFLLRKLP